MLEIGNAIKQDFVFIANSTLDKLAADNVLPGVYSKECCFDLPALADKTSSEDLKNDKHSVIFFLDMTFSDAKIYLQKYTGGDFADETELTDNTYGAFYAFGFFENIFKESAIGYLIEWKKIIDDLDEGRYRIKLEATDLLGNLITQYSLDFCLKQYTDHRADRTVRVNWWLNGLIGDINSDLYKNDYGTLNWFNQIRLPESVFGFDTSTYERKYVKYQNGKQVWLEDSQTEEYSLKTGRFNNDLHRFIKINILQADEISITDYNSGNPVKHVDRYVIPNGNYEPNWYYNSKYASVELKFQQAYQNHNHKRC